LKIDALLQTERTIYRLNLIAILATELMKSRQHQFRGGLKILWRPAPLHRQEP